MEEELKLELENKNKELKTKAEELKLMAEKSAELELKLTKIEEENKALKLEKKERVLDSQVAIFADEEKKKSIRLQLSKIYDLMPEKDFLELSQTILESNDSRIKIEKPKDGDDLDKENLEKELTLGEQIAEAKKISAAANANFYATKQ